MKVLTDFSPKTKYPEHFMISIFIYKHGQQWQPMYIVEQVLINNLGFKVLMVNSGTKHAFKNEKRH